MPDDSPGPPARAAGWAFGIDLAFVLLFTSIGRASHEEGVTITGVLGIAWPFVVALVVGWLVAQRHSGWPVRLPGSTTVWLVTAVLGLALRVATGGGFAWSFGVVPLVVLGVFLVGWRCAAEIGRFLRARATSRGARRGSRAGRASDGPA
jgi:hypothetical protein